MSPEERPDLNLKLNSQDLRRWYWTREELVVFARMLKVPVSGGKEALTKRLVAALDGKDLPTTAKAHSRSNASQLAEPLSRESVIPTGQRCSQTLRAFFQNEIGSGFRFDEPMRTFIHEGAGRTLGAAIECWYATRKTANQQKEIAPQFEYNRFIRHWHQQHPSSSRQQALVAWKEYKSKPVEQRARGKQES